MSSLSPQNLLAYSLQITVLISAGGGLLWLLRLRNPAVRLACFQLILSHLFGSSFPAGMEHKARDAIWLGEFPDGSDRDGPAGHFAA